MRLSKANSVNNRSVCQRVRELTSRSHPASQRSRTTLSLTAHPFSEIGPDMTTPLGPSTASERSGQSPAALQWSRPPPLPPIGLRQTGRRQLPGLMREPTRPLESMRKASQAKNGHATSVSTTASIQPSMCATSVVIATLYLCYLNNIQYIHPQCVCVSTLGKIDGVPARRKKYCINS